MIIVLAENVESYQLILPALEKQSFSIKQFTSISRTQRWLEMHPQPAGLIVELNSASFREFLIRFSLRYPEIPVLTLKEQPEEQLKLRAMGFSGRLSHARKNQKKTRILLVDDSKTILLNYRKLLERQGFEVEVAENAEQGFIKANQQRFDLAILDYFMPDQNGDALCRRLLTNEATSELDCAILTAQYKQQVVDDCIQAGARECMFKNESLELFLARVKALIRSGVRKRQVERERSRLIGLLNSVAEGVYGVTEDGRIQFVNPATLNLLGRSMADLMGQYPHECIHPIDNSGEETAIDHCFLQQAYLLGDELREWRTLFQRADGSVFPVECNVTSLSDEESHQGSVVVFRDISEQQRLEKNWQWQLNHDHLTGLLNRLAFEEILNRELSRIRRTQDLSLLLFIDLDKFKQINDELGHAAGDQLLVNLAENLRNRTRETDHVGRLAGDEFVVLLSHLSEAELAEVAESYRALLEETQLFWEGQNYTITGSIGATKVDSDADSIGELLARADQACQLAKSKGRNQWAIYTAQQAENNEQGNWYRRLSQAIENQQFVLLHQEVSSAQQPKIAIASNCLLRLKEGAALISPAIFMSNAKRFGFIKEIDKKAVRLLTEFCHGKTFAPDYWFSLSLSVEAMSDKGFMDEVLDIWFDSGLSPAQLRFDIGEETLFNFPNWQQHLNELRGHGFGIIISHFGMSSQSLLNLPQMPVDTIRLDTSLTRNLATSLPRCNLIDAVIKTAGQCGVKVIASHIESSAELELLQARGVDLVQGFYLAKPMEFNVNQTGVSR